jgi:hypothetical protein
VCCLCIKQKRPRPKSYAIKGLQNAEGHLYTDNNGIMDPTGKRQKPAKASEKAHRSMAIILQLNPKEPKEQDLINTLIKRFDKTVFQQKLVNELSILTSPFRSSTIKIYETSSTTSKVFVVC